MTGSGFRYALLDAIAIGSAIGANGADENALLSYQTARLRPSQEPASSGRRWGDSYLKS